MSAFTKLASTRWKREFHKLSPENKAWIRDNVRKHSVGTDPDTASNKRGVRRKMLELWAEKHPVYKSETEKRQALQRAIGDRDRLAQKGEAERLRKARQARLDNGWLSRPPKVETPAVAAAEEVPSTLRRAWKSVTSKMSNPTVKRVTTFGAGVATGGLSYTAYKHFKKKKKGD